MPGRRLGSRGKELVANLIEFFQQERDNGGPFIPVTSVRKRVAAALKINISTVTSVSQALKKNEPFVSKQRPHKKPITNIEEFNKCAIRNHITVNILWQKLKEEELFEGCAKSLHTVLNNIGFK
ncbi:hypothetical protein RN001_001884 [Aquatica leii]|uniref:Uncharacterized protein n=1 Tax=Aquatica leii TaxID=1421715 RepID=A0AAN7SR20_9COLE|nr:hypothetical protein RN001_001884 [Aquatica leii]